MLHVLVHTLIDTIKLLSDEEKKEMLLIIKKIKQGAITI